MNIKPKYRKDGIIGGKCVRHSRVGERGCGLNTALKQGGKKMGKEEQRERRRMELNIGVELDQ
eukprot:6211947-Pleurochrysis_carterae.AAC.1